MLKSVTTATSGAARGTALAVAIVAIAGCGKSERHEAKRQPHEPPACATNDPCLNGFFDEDVGECVTEPRTGNPCDDGDACTSNDVCDDGACAGEPRDCDDALGCTLDRCEPGLGCVHETDTSLCDDGNDCTLDVCSAGGECTNEPAPGNVCGDSDCVAESVCEDGECVTQPIDSAGVCYPESIDFGEVIVGMTEERELVLEAADGAFNVESVESARADIEADPPSLPATVDDGDSLAIPVRWTPVAEGALDSRIQVHTDGVTWHVAVTGRALPQPDCDDDNPCTADGFDTMTGECVSEITPNATCSDDNACTVADTCNEAGECVPGNYMECPAGEVCKEGVCRERLCLDPDNLSPVCANVAAPLGEGCLCELVYGTAVPVIRSRIDEIMTRATYDQELIVSAFFAALLTDGWQLAFSSPQLDEVEAALAALSVWDIGMTYAVPGVSFGSGPVGDDGDVQAILIGYDNLRLETNLAELTLLLADAGFLSGMDRHRTIGFSTASPHLIRKVLQASPSELDSLVSVLNAAFENRWTGLNDIEDLGTP